MCLIVSVVEQKITDMYWKPWNAVYTAHIILTIVVGVLA
jgi:hypothetical protein